MDDTEADELLDLLYREADNPEYQVRFRWRDDSVAFWDNRTVQHYATSDYYPDVRIMERASIVGDRPV
jgi:taurine dioxygenase